MSRSAQSVLGKKKRKTELNSDFLFRGDYSFVSAVKPPTGSLETVLEADVFSFLLETETTLKESVMIADNAINKMILIFIC
jgi:hypothetical protein